MFSFYSKNKKGQGLVEYALILVLVAIVVIAVVMILGPVIGNVFSKINTSVASVGSTSYPQFINTIGMSDAPNCSALGLHTGQHIYYYDCYSGTYANPPYNGAIASSVSQTPTGCFQGPVNTCP
jgi:pilus assembly protein Flp/PilA